MASTIYFQALKQVFCHYFEPSMLPKVNYNTYKPVSTLTLKGYMLVAGVRLLYALRRLLGKPLRQHILPNHHEDPLKMTLEEKLYLGQKYYYKAMIAPEAGANTAAYFAQQTLQFDVPKNFVPQQSITLSAGGDLIPYTSINPQTTRELWAEAGDYFFGSDLVFANLETVANPKAPYSAAPEVMLADMYFNIDAKTFDIFNGNGQYRGFDVLSTANNHSMDLGENGILATIEFLQERNIAYCGTANSDAALHNFPILEVKGIKVAFLAYTYSLNKMRLPENKPWLCNHICLNEPNPNLDLVVQQAAIARQKGADVIVASLHMGCAYQAYPGQTTMKHMHQICAAANIDVLLGGHPHHAQPMEVYTHTHANAKTTQHLIVYSLGDFIAYDIFKWGHLPLLLKINLVQGLLDGKKHTQVVGLEAQPFFMWRQHNGQLMLRNFNKLRKAPIKSLGFTKAQQVELAELCDFFDRFVMTPAQQNTLTNPQLG
ncbi:MAG: CapA family protein [Bacteroidetes bacterium]|nr:MAG: CapA family protein [Bacteroidota bacterium]